jgi:hypothetical protein
VRLPDFTPQPNPVGLQTPIETIRSFPTPAELKIVANVNAVAISAKLGAPVDIDSIA